jgi:hypothetical protein
MRTCQKLKSLIKLVARLFYYLCNDTSIASVVFTSLLAFKDEGYNTATYYIPKTQASDVAPFQVQLTTSVSVLLILRTIVPAALRSHIHDLDHVMCSIQ